MMILWFHGPPSFWDKDAVETALYQSLDAVLIDGNVESERLAELEEALFITNLVLCNDLSQ